MATTPSQRRVIRRSRSDRVLGGVCAGLAAYFDVDPILMRIAFILLALAQGAGVVLYLVLWIVVPEAGVEEAPTGGDAIRTGVAGVRADIRRVADEIHGAAPANRHRTAWLGGLLVVVGAFLLVVNLGLFWWWDWRYAGPALLILAGILLLLRRVR